METNLSLLIHNNSSYLESKLNTNLQHLVYVFMCFTGHYIFLVSAVHLNSPEVWHMYFKSSMWITMLYKIVNG